MRSISKTLAVFALATGSITATTSFADVPGYQHELLIEVSQFEMGDEIDGMSQFFNYSYYFSPVSSGEYPYHEAPFVSRVSRLFTGIMSGTTNDGNVTIDRRMFGVGMEVSEQDWPVGFLASYARYTSDIDSSSPYTWTTDSLLGRLYAYVGTTTALSLSVTSSNSGADVAWVEESESLQWTLRLRSLFDLGAGMYGAVNVATTTSVERETSEYDSNSHSLFLAWYPIRALNITAGSGLTASSDSDFNDQLFRSVSIGWSFTPQLLAAFETRYRDIESSPDEASQTISFEFRL